MHIPRGSFLLYLKFSAVYSVFSSAKSGIGFCVFVLSQNALGVHPLRSISPGGKLFFFQDQGRRYAACWNGSGVWFLLLGDTFVPTRKPCQQGVWQQDCFVCFQYFCLSFSTVFILCCQCRAGSLLCLMDGYMHTFNLTACSGRTLCLRFLLLFSIHHLSFPSLF